MAQKIMLQRVIDYEHDKNIVKHTLKLKEKEEKKSQRPRPSGRALKKGNNSLAASIPTLPGGALKGGGKN